MQIEETVNKEKKQKKWKRKWTESYKESSSASKNFAAEIRNPEKFHFCFPSPNKKFRVFFFWERELKKKKTPWIHWNSISETCKQNAIFIKDSNCAIFLLIFYD